MRIIAVLTLLSIMPAMGMFRSSKDLLPFIMAQGKQIQIYPKYQKQLPLPSQKTKIKSQAEQTKANAQKSKTNDLQQQKEKRNND